MMKKLLFTAAIAMLWGAAKAQVSNVLPAPEEPVNVVHSDSMAATMAPPAEPGWYNCSGTFNIERNGATQSFGPLLRLRKIDGESFEIKAGGKKTNDSTMIVRIKTLNPMQILRPGMTYVSEGSLENGETFEISVLNRTSKEVLTTPEFGNVIRISSMRGSAIKGEVKGTFIDKNGAKEPFTGNFDIIDSQYGK